MLIPFVFLFLGDDCIPPVCSGSPFKHPLSNLSLCVYLSKNKKKIFLHCSGKLPVHCWCHFTIPNKFHNLLILHRKLFDNSEMSFPEQPQLGISCQLCWSCTFSPNPFHSTIISCLVCRKYSCNFFMNTVLLFLIGKMMLI